ncbi:MAG: leucine-rich repeat domain-containing protein [Spirochaetaceae bacterium]|jgi:hypothetical protein|nr:leucine-rich repeat domain-containing protein [Spirochaetaceae bacterium]
MHKIKLLIFLMAAGCSIPLAAQEERLFTTRIETRNREQALAITGYNGNAKNIVIPARINGIPVRRICDNAFNLKMLNDVTIPEGIESIGARAFFGNRLSKVEIPSSVKEIAASAFDSNMLRLVTSGGNAGAYANAPAANEKIYYVYNDSQRRSGTVLTKTGAENMNCERYNPIKGYKTDYVPVFTASTVSAPKRQAKPASKIYDLTAFNQPDSLPCLPAARRNTNTVSYRFPDASKTPANSAADLTSPADSNHSGTPVKMNSESGIGKLAYRNMALASIVIPDGVKFIGDGAFSSNSLTSVVIPPSVRQIGNQAFTGNNLVSITIGENVSIQYDSFRYQFSDYYRMNGYRAGTYDLKSGHWNFRG